VTRRLALGALMAAARLVAGEQTPAEKLIVEGHWKRARDLVEPRYREAPDDPLANFLLSQIRNAFGNREAPPKLAEKAVALAPNVAKFHRQMAEVIGVMAQQANMLRQLMLARRFQHEIDAALALDPKDLQALRDLMEFYLLAPGIVGGDQEKARSTAARITAIDLSEGYLAKARLAGFRKEAGRVEGLLKKAVEADPGNFRAREALATYELAPEHQNLDIAAAQGRDAIACDHGRVLGYSILAEVYAAQESWSELDALLETAEKNVPDDLTPYFRAADRLLRTGRDPARAERYLRKYVSQEPEGNEPTLATAQAKLAEAQRAAR
jgi:tetratricopeptide (TPR) repeat protein